ncbi:MAG: hypothetical protein EBS54_00710 [Betaproteobacteria bacterium]|nr:hypothetical protein [Betaproteobacteria bacterium]
MHSIYTPRAMKGFKVQGKELAAAFFQCFGFALLFLPFGTTASAQPVGEVLFAVGSASVQGSSGSSLQRGSFVSVGDVLETGAGSHVHIRFVDGALLSVRPNSRLAIDQYQFDAERPQASQVKFQCGCAWYRFCDGDLSTSDIGGGQHGSGGCSAAGPRLFSG